jgi:hypothetical protein
MYRGRGAFKILPNDVFQMIVKMLTPLSERMLAITFGETYKFENVNCWKYYEEFARWFVEAAAENNTDALKWLYNNILEQNYTIRLYEVAGKYSCIDFIKWLLRKARPKKSVKHTGLWYFKRHQPNHYGALMLALQRAVDNGNDELVEIIMADVRTDPARYMEYSFLIEGGNDFYTSHGIPENLIPRC